MEEEFSFGLVNPTEIVVDGDINSPGVQEAIGKLQTSLMADSRLLVPPVPPEVNSSGDLALLTVIIPGEPSSQGWRRLEAFRPHQDSSRTAKTPPEPF